MILTDKGYFDYDYEQTDKPTTVVDWEKTIKTDEEVHSMLAMFGMGKNKEEYLQSYIIKEEQKKCQ